MDTTDLRGALQEMAGYISEDTTSSDESIISVIPNKRPIQTFTPYKSAIKKEERSSKAAQRSTGDEEYSDADLEIVKSDIPQPRQPHVHAGGAGPEASSLTAKKRKAPLPDLAGNKHEDDEDDDDGHEPPPKRIASARDRSYLNSSAFNSRSGTDVSGYSPRQVDLWEYIRPHLHRFRNSPIPKHSWVLDLLKLPRVRDFKANPRNSEKRRFVDTDAKSIAALVLYLTGTVQVDPCSKCINGNGVFDGCVKLPGDVYPGSRIRNCANCWYQHQACSHEKAQQDVDDDVAYDLATPETLETDSDGESIGEASPQRLEETETREPPPKPPPILHALSGRPYCKWPDKDGSLVTLKSNVLLPDGYATDIDGRRPCTCPVDICSRRSFAHLRALGFHFPRNHYGQLLNDNCDGTFSIVGSYDDRKLLNGGAYPDAVPSFPYVVSQNPKGGRSRPRAAADTDREAIVKQPVPNGVTRDPSELVWEYIKPHLAKTTAIPDKGWVKELLPLPRVRDLRWNPHRSSDFYETHPRDISCLIIQVTGDEAPKPCTKCARGKGPFAGCVVISRDAPPEVRARMVSCANCNYHNRQVDCSLINWVVNRPQPPWPGYLGKGGKLVRGPSDSIASAAIPEKPRMSDRRQTELIAPNDRDWKVLDYADRGASEPEARTEVPGPAGSRYVKEITRRRPASPSAESTAPIRLGRSNAEGLEMQDWEIAPGYIRGRTSKTQGSNIAESGPYLSSGRASQVLNTGVEVELVILSMGQKKSFAPLADKVRSCTVMEGRLKVKIGEDPAFSMGPRGRFQIPRGVSAWAQNKLYSESVFDMYTAREYD